MNVSVRLERLLPGFAPFARVWIIFACASFTVLVTADLFRLEGVRIGPHAVIGRDFVNVWIGGKLAWINQPSIVYDIDAYRQFLENRLNIRDIYAYSYPPSTLPIAMLFAPMPYWLALMAWTFAGIIAFYCAARPYFNALGLPTLLALCNPAAFVCIWAGHYGLLVGALALAGWRLLDDRPRAAGILFGLMTIKPHLGILIALVLLVQRRWTAIIYAALTFGALFLVSSALFGFNTWSVYLLHTLGFHAELLTRGVAAFHSMMPTVTASLLRMNVSEPLINAVQAASAAFAILVVLFASRRGVKTTDSGLIAASAVFLALPYAFNYDMTVVSAAALLFAARQDYSYSTMEKLALTAGFLLPLLLGPGRTYMAMGPAIMVLLLLVQLKIAVATRPP